MGGDELWHRLLEDGIVPTTAKVCLEIQRRKFARRIESVANNTDGP